jgi:hypothetical protein
MSERILRERCAILKNIGVDVYLTENDLGIRNFTIVDHWHAYRPQRRINQVNIEKAHQEAAQAAERYVHDQRYCPGCVIRKYCEPQPFSVYGLNTDSNNSYPAIRPSDNILSLDDDQ